MFEEIARRKRNPRDKKRREQQRKRNKSKREGKKVDRREWKKERHKENSFLSDLLGLDIESVNDYIEECYKEEDDEITEA